MSKLYLNKYEVIGIIYLTNNIYDISTYDFEDLFNNINIHEFFAVMLKLFKLTSNFLNNKVTYAYFRYLTKNTTAKHLLREWRTCV